MSSSFYPSSPYLFPLLTPPPPVTQDMIHVAEHKVGRRFGDYFIRNVSKFEDVVSAMGRRPVDKV